MPASKGVAVVSEPTPSADELWQRFHEVVNMTSPELTDWLGVTEDLAPDPGQQAPPLGVGVLAVLRKRRTDLTAEDLNVMARAIGVVEDETAGRTRQEIVSDERRRFRLCNVGHDPLRAG